MKVQDNDALVSANFKLHPILNQAKSQKAERPIYDEIELCEIKMAANKQTVGAFPAHEIYAHEEDPNTGERRPVTYAMKFNKQYLAFKNGDAQAQSGTPLEALPFLTPGKRLELKALNIHTAETLANLDGQPLKQLGMGGRDLKDKARAYIDSAGDHAVEGQMAEVVSAQDRRIAELEAQIAKLSGGKSGMPAQSPEQAKAGKADDGTPNAADVLAMADTAHFKTFQAAAKRVLGDDTPATKDEIVDALKAKAGEGGSNSPFADYDDADIRNWLKEAAPDLDTSDFSREALIEAADEVNKAMAEKNKA